jgi:hypothetical protein
MNATAFSFKPAKPVDKVGDAIRSQLKITEEEEVKSTKTLLEDIKKYKSENGNKLSLEFFKKVALLKCCKAQDDDAAKAKMTFSLNANMIGR